MPYQLLILRKAQKELERLENEPYQRIKNSIYDLSQNPRPDGIRKLTNRDGWRIRVGAYRIIYEIDDTQQTILIMAIGHRSDVYRS